MSTAAAATITLAELFRRSARISANRPAIAWEGGEMTYAELDRRTDRLANALAGLGYGDGSRIAVLSETRPEFCELYMACAKLGVTLVTLNIRLLPDEIADCIDLAGPEALFTSAMLAPTAEASRTRTPSIRRWYCFDDFPDSDYGDYADLVAGGAAGFAARTLDPEGIHNVLYTSGTTGKPKGAMISRRAAAIRGLRIAQFFQLRPDDGFVGWLPLYHCGGDESLYASLLTGGAYATLPRAEPERMFRMIERHRLTWTLMLPGVVTDFLQNPARRRHDLSSMRFTFGYANLLAPQVVIDLTMALDAPYWDAFGQTETSYLVAYGEVPVGQKPNLRKLPTPFIDIAIVDDGMNELLVGVPGECVVRGPSLMSGYLANPAATDEVFRDGWLHTGDVLVRNDDGSLTFTDRKKYLIKTGGENVYPAEVEQVISQLEGVQEACVIGVPDERWGESVKACIVVRSGHSVTAGEVVDWCRSRLASYKKPRYVEFLSVAEVPRSVTGKILRGDLVRRPTTPDQVVQTTNA